MPIRSFVRRRPVVWGGAALLALSAVAVTGVLSSGAHAAGEPAATGPQVPVLTVGERAVGDGLTLDGSLQAVRQSVLSAQASGRIATLAVKAGDRVKAGQVLATIDDRVTQAGVAQAQAGVAQAQAALVNAQAQFDRTKELRSQGFVAQAALDTAQAQLKAAQAAVNAARAGQAQSDLAQGFTRLTAPYDGWVLATHAEAGSLAQPGSPVLTVYAPQPIRAVVHVPASQQVLAEQAQRVEVLLPGTTRWVKPAACRPPIRSRRRWNGAWTSAPKTAPPRCLAVRCRCASWAGRRSACWCRPLRCCGAANSRRCTWRPKAARPSCCAPCAWGLRTARPALRCWPACVAASVWRKTPCAPAWRAPAPHPEEAA